MKVWVRGEARAEAAAAAGWYEREARLGNAFRAALRTALRRIEEQPQLYAVVYRDLRRAPLRRFPFGVFYIYDECENSVTVYGVIHDARNPEVWKRRR